MPAAALQKATHDADEEADAQRVAGLADEFVHPVVDQRECRRRQQVPHDRELLLHRHDVERQAVDRDQHADRREQRQRGVEAAPRGGERHLIGDGLPQRAQHHPAPAGPAGSEPFR